MADERRRRHHGAVPPFDLGETPLPDVMDLLEFLAAEQDGVPGPLRYALRLADEIDRPRLRGIYDAQKVSIAWDRRRRAYAITYDPRRTSPDEELLLLQVETVVNRMARLLGHLDGVEPLEEVCSVLDVREFQQVTSEVPVLLERAEDHAWSLGSVPSGCAPGGEWDVRTRIAAACESFSPVTRLEHRFACDASAGLVAMEFSAADESAMPHSIYDEDAGRWLTLDACSRRRLAHEHACRLSLVLAAAAFSAGIAVRRCSVTALDALGARELFTVVFERSHFLSICVPLARTLVRQPLMGLACSRALEFEQGAPVLPCDVQHDSRWVRPREDERSLPDSLRGLLLADTPGELDVSEPDADSSMARFEQLYLLIWIDPARAARDLGRFIDELEVECALTELDGSPNVRVRYCGSQIERVLLPVTELDPQVRIKRAPDALFYAQCELSRLYMGMGEYELALVEAGHLIDLAPVSSEACFILVNVLARLERYEDVVKACNHGLRIAHSRSVASYLYYRMAFACWNLGEVELALACYAMVPEGEQVTGPAREEMATLLERMGRSRPPSPAEASSTLYREGIYRFPSEDVLGQLTDAAVLLCESGFFQLARPCVECLQGLTGRDELEAVAESLGPRC